MSLSLRIAAEIAAVIAIVILFQATLIYLRRPTRPGWLRRVEGSIAVVFLLAIAIAVPLLISDLIAAGIDLLVALPIGVAIPVAVAIIGARTLSLKARLRQAEPGN